MRRFKPVPKDKKYKDIPSKYLKIRRTRRLYRMGRLTGAMMDRISKERAAD